MSQLAQESVLALDDVSIRARGREPLGAVYAGVASNVQMRSMLYTAATIVPASRGVVSP